MFLKNSNIISSSLFSIAKSNKDFKSISVNILIFIFFISSINEINPYFPMKGAIGNLCKSIISLIIVNIKGFLPSHILTTNLLIISSKDKFCFNFLFF